jgi:hypothetical protein
MMRKPLCLGHALPHGILRIVRIMESSGLMGTPSLTESMHAVYCFCV